MAVRESDVHVVYSGNAAWLTWFLGDELSHVLQERAKELTEAQADPNLERVTVTPGHVRQALEELGLDWLYTDGVAQKIEEHRREQEEFFRRYEESRKSWWQKLLHRT